MARNPWRVLVSEVMLQQIQVKRAIPFYESFLAQFPTPRALADAPLAEAIRAWGDLGRYRRVVNLHWTARILAEEFGGKVPSDPELLVKLPGIGPYTASAVACFAFEKDTPFSGPLGNRASGTVLSRKLGGVEKRAEATIPRPCYLLLAKISEQTSQGLRSLMRPINEPAAAPQMGGNDP